MIAHLLSKVDSSLAMCSLLSMGAGLPRPLMSTMPLNKLSQARRLLS